MFSHAGLTNAKKIDEMDDLIYPKLTSENVGLESNLDPQRSSYMTDSHITTVILTKHIFVGLKYFRV